MNYCFMKNVLELLEWGYRKEIFVVKLYFKKFNYKYCDLFLKESGLVVNLFWFFFGVLLDCV